MSPPSTTRGGATREIFLKRNLTGTGLYRTPHTFLEGFANNQRCVKRFVCSDRQKAERNLKASSTDLANNDNDSKLAASCTHVPFAIILSEAP